MPTAALKFRDLVQAFREEVDDTGGDTVSADECAWENDDDGLLWSNREAVRYANEAQQEFCRRRPIQDSTTTAICQIAVVAGTATYAYDQRIMYIEDARLDLAPTSLQKRTTQYLEARYNDWRDKDATQYPVDYIEDLDEYKLQLVFKPSVNDTLNLVVGRLPLTDMRWTHRVTDTPEIHARHHLDLVHWMAHRAYMKRDSQTFNEKRSAMYEAKFNAVVGPRPNARVENERRKEKNLTRRIKPHFF